METLSGFKSLRLGRETVNWANADGLGLRLSVCPILGDLQKARPEDQGIRGDIENNAWRIFLAQQFQGTSGPVVSFAGEHKNRIGVLRFINNQKLSGIRDQPGQRQ